MDLLKLQKEIHDAAMAVRRGDWSQWDKLQDLRAQHRAACGVAEQEAPKPVELEQKEPKPEEQAEDKPKKSKKK